MALVRVKWEVVIGGERESRCNSLTHSQTLRHYIYIIIIIIIIIITAKFRIPPLTITIAALAQAATFSTFRWKIIYKEANVLHII